MTVEEAKKLDENGFKECMANVNGKPDTSIKFKNINNTNLWWRYKAAEISKIQKIEWESLQRGWK